MEIRGYETRRSDWSPLCKELQNKTLRYILIDNIKEEEYGRFIRNIKKSFYAGEFDNVIKWGKGLNSWTKDHETRSDGAKKTKTIQQRASEYANEAFSKNFKQYDKPWLCYIKGTKSGENYDIMAFDIDENPSDTCIVDYDTMWEKQIKNPLKRIVEPLGWDWEYIESGKKVNELSMFF
jgi:DNA polymerase elongation subunit (family B)